MQRLQKRAKAIYETLIEHRVFKHPLVATVLGGLIVLAIAGLVRERTRSSQGHANPPVTATSTRLVSPTLPHALAVAVPPATPAPLAIAEAAYRGNPARTGEVPGPGPAQPPKQLWHVTLSGFMLEPPVVARAMVYVGSDQAGLYAFDAKTGSGRWRVLGGSEVGPPQVVGQVVYAVGHGSAGTFLYAFDADDGTTKWHVALGASDPFVPLASPAVANGMVFVGSTDTLYAFAASSGKELWRIPVQAMSTAPPSENLPIAVPPSPTEAGATPPVVRRVLVPTPAVAQGQVFVSVNTWHEHASGSTTYTDQTLYAFDEQTGNERWHANQFVALYQSGPELSAPAFSNGFVFVAAGTGVYKFDAAIGRELWRKYLQSSIASDLTVTGERVLCDTEGGTLYALNVTDGSIAWTYDVGLFGGMYAPTTPVFVGNTIYLSRQDKGLLVALDEASGAVQWHEDVPGPAPYLTVVAGDIFITGFDQVDALGTS